MLKRSVSLRRALAGAVALVTTAGLVWTARAQEQTTRNVTLSHADVSQDPTTGQTVITMPSRGDLPGVLTVAVTRDAAGTVTGGQWSLVVSYTQITLASGEVVIDPPGGAEKEEEGHAPGGSDAFVQKGVVKGSVASGSVTLNADGTLQSLNDLVLSVTGGTLEYAAATSGNGVLTAGNLSARAVSSGVASLTF